MIEGCRRLDSVAPLKPGMRHCPWCAGYGARPPEKGETRQPQRCFRCDGTGLLPQDILD